MVRNIVRMTTAPSGRVNVLCVDEHLRYVNFSLPRAFSTLEDAEAIMQAVLDHRARTYQWRQRGNVL